MHKISLIHTNTHTEMCVLLYHVRHWWHFAQNYARRWSSTASVHQRHELGRPAAALLSIFCSQAGSDLCVGCQSLVKQKQDWYLSLQKVDCLLLSVSSSRSIALL